MAKARLETNKDSGEADRKTPDNDADEKMGVMVRRDKRAFLPVSSLEGGDLMFLKFKMFVFCRPQLFLPLLLPIHAFFEGAGEGGDQQKAGAEGSGREAEKDHGTSWSHYFFFGCFCVRSVLFFVLPPCLFDTPGSWTSV